MNTCIHLWTCMYVQFIFIYEHIFLNMHIYKSRTFVYIIMTNIHSGNVDLSGIFFFLPPFEGLRLSCRICRIFFFFGEFRPVNEYIPSSIGSKNQPSSMFGFHHLCMTRLYYNNTIIIFSQGPSLNEARGLRFLVGKLKRMTIFQFLY